MVRKKSSHTSAKGRHASTHHVSSKGHKSGGSRHLSSAASAMKGHLRVYHTKTGWTVVESTGMIHVGRSGAAGAQHKVRKMTHAQYAKAVASLLHHHRKIVAAGGGHSTGHSHKPKKPHEPIILTDAPVAVTSTNYHVPGPPTLSAPTMHRHPHH